MSIIIKGCRKEKDKGFTLVELITVLVILAILAAILIPSLVKYIDKAQQGEAIVMAHNAIEAAKCVIIEEYAQGVDFSTGRGFANITDRDSEIQDRIYALSGIDKTKYTIANVDVNEKGELIFLNLYSRKTVNKQPNRLVYINGTVGGKKYNGELIISCWDGVVYKEYRSLDPGWVGYKSQTEIG